MLCPWEGATGAWVTGIGPSFCREGLLSWLCQQAPARTWLPLLPGLGCPLSSLSSRALQQQGAVDGQGSGSQGRDDSRELVREGVSGPAGCQGFTQMPPLPSRSFSELHWASCRGREGLACAHGRGPLAVLVDRMCFRVSCGHPRGLCQPGKVVILMGGTWARAPHPRPLCEQCHWVL